MIRPRESSVGGEPQLPFDPVTVALAVLTRWRVAAAILLGAGLAAFNRNWIGRMVSVGKPASNATALPIIWVLA